LEKMTPYADAGARMDFYEIQQLIDRQILENGEAIILPMMLDNPDRPYSLALQVIESDRLDTPPGMQGDRSIRSGVRIGDKGEPVSYSFKRRIRGYPLHKTNRTRVYRDSAKK